MYICVSIYAHTYIYIILHIFFHYGLSQDDEYSSLCSTVGLFCLSILYAIALISLNLTLPILLSLPLRNLKHVVSVCESVFCR